MTIVGPGDVRVFLKDFLSQKAKGAGYSIPTDIGDDFDLLLSGTIDSLGLLDLLTAIQEHFGQQIDFETLDPEKMTVVGPLCEFVAAQLRMR